MDTTKSYTAPSIERLGKGTVSTPRVVFCSWWYLTTDVPSLNLLRTNLAYSTFSSLGLWEKHCDASLLYSVAGFMKLFCRCFHPWWKELFSMALGKLSFLVWMTYRAKSWWIPLILTSCFPWFLTRPSSNTSSVVPGRVCAVIYVKPLLQWMQHLGWRWKIWKNPPVQGTRDHEITWTCH